MRHQGIPYAEMESYGIHLPVIDLRVRYHRPALYDQLIEVWTHIAELTRTTVRFGYRLRVAGESQVLATGHTVHATVDPRGRIVRMDRHPEMWSRLRAAAALLEENDLAG